jgi:quinol monooxygenase YgiN
LIQVRPYDDRDRGGVYFIEAVFSSREEAEQNNSRPETQAWAARPRDLIDGEPFYCNLDPLGELVGSRKGE